VRVRELELAAPYGDRLNRILVEATQDGTIGPVAAYRVHRALARMIAVSGDPKRVLERAKQYLEPLYKTGPWVDERLTALLVRLQAATNLRELALEQPPHDAFAALLVSSTADGTLGIAAGERIHRVAMETLEATDEPERVLELARRYLQPLEKLGQYASGERAGKILRQIEAAVRVQQGGEAR
jgi:hypothetical protein